jgi:15-cis-phytoene synthase
MPSGPRVSEIGAQIHRNGMDNVTLRAVVSKPRKLALLSRAYVAPLVATTRSGLDCLSEAHELVMACGEQLRLRPKMSFMARVSWVLDLMERIESARLDEAKRARQ